MAQVIKNRFLRITIRLLIAILLLPLLMAGLLQFPAIQTKAISYVGKRISKTTGHDISIKRVSISWFDEVEVDNVVLFDIQGNPMLSVEQVKMDFDIVSLITGQGRIHQNHLELENPRAYFTFVALPDSSVILNINHFIKSFNLLADPDKPKKEFEVWMDEVSVKGGSFQYENSFGATRPEGFDPNHFHFENIYATLYDFKVIPGEVLAKIEGLKLVENNIAFRVNSLNTNFHLSPQSMTFSNLKLISDNTIIGDSLAFSFNRLRDFSYIYDSVQIEAKLVNSHIHRDDLRKMMPQVSKFPSELTVSGEFSGTLSDFRMVNFLAEFGQHTRLVGAVQMSGLPDIDETFLNANLYNSRLTFSDIQPFTGLGKLAITENLGIITFRGRFLGYINDFVAEGNFNTGFGQIQSDLNIKIPADRVPGYSGRLMLSKFHLGDLLGNNVLGNCDFNGSINGEGFDLASADFNVTGNLASIEVDGYKYKNVYSDGRFSEEFFEGFVSVDDENLKMEVDGTLDFKRSPEYVNINTKLEHLDLYNLGYSKSDFRARGNGNISFLGLNPDEIQANTNLNDLVLEADSQRLDFDHVEIISELADHQRTISFNSEVMDMSLVGNYKLSAMYDQLKGLIGDYKKVILNDSVDLINEELELDTLFTYSSEIDFTFNIKSINPFLQLIKSNIYVSDNTMIEGNYISDKISIINLSSFIDTLKLGDYEFQKTTIELSTIKNANQQILATAFIHSDNQLLSGVKTEEFLMEANWDNNFVDFEVNIEQPEFNNKFNINADMHLSGDSTTITLSESSMEFLEIPWDISKDGIIVFKDRQFEVSSLKLQGQDQSINFNGIIAGNSNRPLIIGLDSLDLEIINSLINYELNGRVTGEMYINNALGDITIENDVIITDLHVNKFKVGDAKTSVWWNRSSKQFDIRSSVTYEKQVTIELEGYYEPDSENPLYIDAELIDARINILEPFIGSYFSRLDGTITGGFNITGSIANPRIFGRGQLANGKMTVNYLKTSYNVTGIFSFSEDKIFLDDITVTDMFKNGGKLSGSISHGGFRNMSVDLTGNFRNIQVLNTNSGDNSWFYGQGFASGQIEFDGPVSKLAITANARTEKGTRFYIPIEGTEIIESSEFISFTDFQDSTINIQEVVESVDLTGVTLDVNLDVTTDAYCEIIFDIQAGDIIRGRGTGEISLNINTNGEFNMFGPLTITEGWYNFTLYNLINKEFIIEPGGVITWYGDPYQGIMDLKANYRQIATIAPILDEAYEDSQEIRRKYPANVVMDLNGPLLNPEILFNLSVDDLPVGEVTLTGGQMDGTTIDLQLHFEDFMNRIDEQELKRQVFSLIVLKSFSPEAAFNYGSAFNSVSELLSNQLSYWISQVDQNLEIDFDVDLSELSPEAFNTFQLRLSYTFLDGRLRLTRDGSIVDNQQSVNFTSLAGNWSVEYALTQDGKMKVRMYNRNNYTNTTESYFTGNSTGVSLQYTQSFNEFLREMTKMFNEKGTDKPKKNDDPSGSGLNEDANLKKEDEM